MVRTVRINPKETWIDRLAIKGIQSTESPFTGGILYKLKKSSKEDFFT